MRTLIVVRSTAVALLAIASVGCENLQPVIESLEKEQAEFAVKLSEASEKVEKLAAENKTLQEVVDSAKAMAAEVQEAANQAQAAAEKELADAKTQSEEMVRIISVKAETKIATAEAEAKKLGADAEEKLAIVVQELKTARARIAELEAEAKKSDAIKNDEKAQ
jgi:ABC-type transporter Mla subunit MlaD